ncbi:MAG: hypothetical protein ACR2PY_03260 [Salinispira sp.]
MNKKLAVYCEDQHTIMDITFCQQMSQYYKLYIFATQIKINRFQEQGVVAHFVPYRQVNNTINPAFSKSGFPIIMKRMQQVFLFGRALFRAMKIKHTLENREINNIVFTTTSSNSQLMGWLAILPVKSSYHTFIHLIHNWYKVKIKRYRRGRLFSFFRSLLLKKIRSCVVLADYLKTELRNYTHIPVAVFPFVCCSVEKLNKREIMLKKVTIPTFVLPGIVQKKQKYYKPIVDIFAGIQNEYRLVFLGKVKDEEEILYAKQKLGNRIISFSGYIDAEKYEETLCSSHFIIRNTATAIPYGIYRMSAMDCESAAYCIPLIYTSKQKIGYFYGEEERCLNEMIRYCMSIVSTNTYYERYEKLKEHALQEMQKDPSREIFLNIESTS